ncbi:MAG: glycosyl hydrolase-related protein [candidate division Zixibacteria bacterium]|nr:glycosyl hydrolase-related protein [candidate division Zixibacteria bacterium]
MRKIILVTITLLLGSCIWVSAQTDPQSGGQKKRNLNVVATAHLDTQWRWTIKNTIDEYVPATFRDNFKLMDQYPDYVFSFEGAFRYMLLREYYPEEYAKLRQYIARRQWRVCGSWVDAVDVNIPSFESLVRQVLYGNGYFKREFGVTSHDVFLPDCFGFGYALPSISAHCGLKSFSTQKLSWGSAYGVPFDIGRWEGVDGSSLVAGIRPGDYVAKIRGDLSRDTTWLAATKRQFEVSGLPLAYMYFGTGDTGGSPDSLSVDWLHKSMQSDGPLRVASVGADDLVDIVGEQNIGRLPSYKGELLMTRHGVGCYTSQATMKRWNRKNELLADATERASVIAHSLGALPYPTQNLRDTWIRFLWHQFHDDITGTSIPEAYEFSWNDEILSQNRFAGMLTAAVGATSAALDTRAKGVPLVVFNPLSINRQDMVDAVVAFDKKAPAHVRVFGPDGKEVLSQVLARFEDSLQVLFLANVPSVGYAVYDVRPSDTPCQTSTSLSATEKRLENATYAVSLNDNGDVASIYDKRSKKEVLGQPIVWELFKDKPNRWPAWEIQYEDLQVPPQVLTDPDADIRVIENGPVRVTLEIVRHHGQSTFRTRVSLAAGNVAGERIEFHNDVDWYEKETLLKAAFRPAQRSDSVTYDLGLGTIKRGINRPELYEVPGHQWADMTAENSSYGLSVLNDCRYGWDHPDPGTLRLTLIHTPGVFENWSWVGDQSSQDMGHHEFAYAVSVHRERETLTGTVLQAARFNQPLLAFRTTPHEGELGSQFSLVEVKSPRIMPSQESPCREQVMVTAIKKAENSDETIVRIRELCGIQADSVKLVFPWGVTSARELDGAENPKADAEFTGKTLKTSLTPYQPKTFAVTFAQPKNKITPPEWKPVPLVFDMDGVSLDSDRRDDDFDGHGNTIAGELLPDTIFNYGIGFVTGPKAAGANNLMTCKGQKIALPSGDYDHLWLLAASVDGPTKGSLRSGTWELRFQSRTTPPP